MHAPAETVDLTPAPLRSKPVWFEANGPLDTPCYARSALRPGQHLAGPAIILQYDTTVMVAPGWVVEVDPALNLWLVG